MKTTVDIPARGVLCSRVASNDASPSEMGRNAVYDTQKFQHCCRQRPCQRAERPLRHLTAGGSNVELSHLIMFAKVFAQIFDSSIADNRSLRHFFMDMLVLADCNGVVDMTPTAIAGRTRWPIDDVVKHLASLEGPDDQSRTPDHNGARIAKLDEHRSWGWVILNHDRFREIASEEQRRSKTLARVRKYRETRGLQSCNAPVTPINACNVMQKQIHKQIQIQNKKTKDVSPIQQFCEKWQGAHEEAFGNKGVLAAKRSVATLLACGLSPDALIDVARKAWANSDPKAFWLPKARDMKTFCEKFELIQAELAKPNGAPKVETHQMQEDIKVPVWRTVNGESVVSYE